MKGFQAELLDKAPDQGDNSICGGNINYRSSFVLQKHRTYMFGHDKHASQIDVKFLKHGVILENPPVFDQIETRTSGQWQRINQSCNRPIKASDVFDNPFDLLFVRDVARMHEYTSRERGGQFFTLSFE